jgi:hypothetical protein
MQWSGHQQRSALARVAAGVGGHCRREHHRLRVRLALDGVQDRGHDCRPQFDAAGGPRGRLGLDEEDVVTAAFMHLLHTHRITCAGHLQAYRLRACNARGHTATHSDGSKSHRRGWSRWCSTPDALGRERTCKAPFHIAKHAERHKCDHHGHTVACVFRLCIICARFQHSSHKCDRRRQSLVVLSYTSVETF